MGKDVTEGRSPHRQLAPDTVGPETHKPTSLWGIADKAKADKHHRVRDLYRCLNVGLLLECWGDLNKDAASGVDGVTWQAYAENLQTNVEALVERLKQKRYRAKLIRRHYIPKDNGQERPLGIPAIEDKLLQAACARILNAIYEQEFLACSYGYRPERGARDAVRDLTFDLQYGRYGYVVEADIKGFLNHASCGLRRTRPGEDTPREREGGSTRGAGMCPCGNHRKSSRSSGRSGKRASRGAGSRGTRSGPRRLRWDTQGALTPSAVASWETGPHPGTWRGRGPR
jgi:Reverse transcriptase (RNA-dependent DNA polymerase)